MYQYVLWNVWMNRYELLYVSVCIVVTRLRFNHPVINNVVTAKKMYYLATEYRTIIASISVLFVGKNYVLSWHGFFSTNHNS